MRVNSGDVSKGLGQSGVPGTVSHSGNRGNRGVESVCTYVCVCVCFRARGLHSRATMCCLSIVFPM